MSGIYSKDIWKEVRPVSLTQINPVNLPELYRFSLQNLNEFCVDALPLSKLNLDYERSRTIVSDRYTYKNGLKKLPNLPLYAKKSSDGDGWIYMYTNAQELRDGEEEIGWLWWYQKQYKCRIKIGRTGKHPIQRIREQQGTGVPHLPLILGLLWSPSIEKADNLLKARLKPFIARNSGGQEWYDIRPNRALDIILESLQNCRINEMLASSN